MSLQTQDSPHRSFGRFQLVLEMARGGMATIYLARLQGPQQFEKLVVVKRIHEHQAQDARFVQMFLDEARIAARIEHPNVATVFDLGEQDGAYFLAMEYVHGHNVAEVVRSAVRHEDLLHWSLVVRMVADAAAGLHAAHEARGVDGRCLGIVHRDVSPQNILISYDGHVKVVDFGIAYAAERLTHTASGTVKGKAAYMSPEQVCMEPMDRRSDVFSLGIVLYEAACRRRLFKERLEAATILRVRDAQVPPPRSMNPEIPVALERVMLKALARHPQDRFQTAGAMEEALDQVLHDTGHPVSHRHLAALMETLFHDVRKLRDGQIRDALEVRDERGPMRAMGVGGSTDSGTTEAPASTLLQRPQGSWRRRMLVPAAVALAGMVAVAVILRPRCGDAADGDGHAEVTRSHPLRPSAEPTGGGHLATPAGEATETRRDPAPKPREAVMQPRLRPSPREMVSPAEERVSLEVSIRPLEARAEVRFRGHRYPGSELNLKVLPSAAAEIIEIWAPGYRTVREQVVLSTDVRRSIRLHPDLRSPSSGRATDMARPRKSAADLTKKLPED